MHFFGVRADADAALQKYLNERGELQEGRTPQHGNARFEGWNSCLFVGVAA